MTLCDGKVAIVTGGGRGIGREHCLALAKHGAKVVVNDFGGTVDGKPGTGGVAEELVSEIEELGGTAIANDGDIAKFDDARALIEQAIDQFGRLDILVNNAGILRDKTLAKMTESDWDDVLRVHAKGSFATLQVAARYWRDQAKSGNDVDARVINTTSAAGLYGNVGQGNYAAAKAAVAALTLVAAVELERYGVAVNAISPGGVTRMTEFALAQLPEEQRERMAPHFPAALLVWLASYDAKGITGRVIEITGNRVGIVEGWRMGPSGDSDEDPLALGETVRELLKKAKPNANIFGE